MHTTQIEADLQFFYEVPKHTLVVTILGLNFVHSDSQ